MANSLGVKIKIDYSEIDKLESKLDKLVKDREIELKIDTSSAVNKLKTFEDKFDKVKEKLNESLKLKIDASDFNIDSAFKGLAKNGKEVNNVVENVSSTTKDMANDLKQTDSLYSKVAQSSKILAEESNKGKDATKDATKALNDQANAQEKTAKASQEKKTTLNDIAKKIKEIGALERKQVGADDQSKKAIQERIDLLKKQKTALEEAYKINTGQSAGDSALVKDVKAAQDLSTELKQISQQKAEQNQLTKEAQSIVSQVTKLENERFSILKKAQTAGQEEASVMLKRANAIDDEKNALIKRSDLFSKANVEQLQSLNTLTQQNSIQLEYTQNIRSASEADRARAEAQKATFSELKSELKQIESLQSKITELQAKENNDSINGKDSQRLASMKEELELREQSYAKLKSASTEQGNLSSKQSEYLSKIEKEASAKQKSAEETAKINADLSKSKQLYDEMESSVKKVSSMKSKMATAGDEEKAILQEVIALEEKKQAIIQETLSKEGLKNTKREDEVSDLKEQLSLQERINQAKANDKASASASYEPEQNVGILGDLLNPRAIFGDVKQAAMTIYDSVSTIDSAMVDVAKVAEASDSELKQFSDTIYDTASQVGKSAEEYAVSVERWASAGYDLQESIELSNVSVMGSFVGNIDEASMVDYMSIPLNAYKDSALEAEDVVNAMNEVANKNAIEMDDLGKAYSRAAATSAQAGTSFAELTGIISAGQEATRASGESVGNAIKAMDVNFGKISTQNTKSDVEKYSFFKKLGVNIKDDNDQLRSTYDIMEDLQGAWGKMSKTEQSQAGFYAAGKNFQNIFSGIMGSWDAVTKATNEAQEQLGLIDKTSGSAFKEFEVQQDSIEFKAANLKNSWAEFLNTIAGGKDGVTTVMAALNDGLQKATELAKNDTFMGIAKGVGKIVGTMTGITIIEKFFNTITKGSLGVLTNLGKVNEAGKLTGWAKGLSGVLGIGGKVIPAIGGITLALTALDAIGVPIFDTIKKGFESMKGAIHPAKKEMDDYAKSQEDAIKGLKDNKILNGEIENTNKVIASYQELRKQKEKAFKNGDKNARHYSTDEFQQIKEDFNTTAESLGADIRITMNDYDDIERKYQKLIEYNNALSGKELTELTKDLGTQGSYSDNSGKREEYMRDNDWEWYFEKNKDKFSDAQKLAQETGRLMSGLDFDFYSSDEMIKAEEENSKRLKNLVDTRRELIGSAKSGALTQAFRNGDIDEDEQKSTIALLGSQLPILNKQKQSYDQISKSIKNGDKLVQDQILSLGELDDSFYDLDTQTSTWDDNMKNNVLKTLGEGTKESKTNIDELKKSLSDIGQVSGMSKEEIKSMTDSLDGGGKSFIDYMSQFGDMGASIVGMTNSMMDFANNNDMVWSDLANNLQKQVDSMDDEVVIKYKLEQDNGVVNFDAIDELFKLPDAVTTKFKLIDESGDINLENTVKMLDEINEKPDVIKEFDIQTDENGVVQLDGFIDTWSELDEDQQKELLFDLGINVDDQANDKIHEIEKVTEEIDGKEVEIGLKAKDLSASTLREVENNFDLFAEGDYSAYLKANPLEADASIAEVQTKLSTYNLLSPEAKLNADNQDTLTKYAEAHGLTVSFNEDTGEATFKGDNSDAINKSNEAIKSVSDYDGSTGHSTMTADNKDALANIRSAINALSGFKSKTITLTTVKNTIVNGAKAIGKKLFGDDSVSIGNSITPQLGSSFSASVGSQIAGTSKNTSIGKSQSKSSSKSSNSDARVNSDVWRYWSKELFKGLPLENSMDDLKRSIDNAGDNQNKLISLYKQQNTLLNKQIAYNKELKSAQQSEMNSILSQLRKQGFKTKGNQITNLGIAKNFKGDKASNVDKLLSDYNSLYKSINDLNGTIKDLKQQQTELKESIKEANIAKEAKKIESSLKKSEAILTSIDNANAIQSTKESLVKDNDYEFSMSIKEQGMNTASTSMDKLINEYNRLAKSSVSYAENAEDVQSQLSTLKDSILENADAVLQYREEIETIKIDRLINDFEKFNDVMNNNIDAVANNIDNLKDGLVSGTKLSDLYSSNLSTLDLTRKTKYQKEQEDRIKLEAELDAAIDGYAKKNVDRTQKVANSVLQIEKNKYNSLMKMAKDYSNGKAISSTTSTKASVDYGIMGATESDKSYSKWKQRLEKVNKDYADAYKKIVNEYDKAIANSSGGAKEDLNNQMIIDQLKLQEKMQQTLIDLNNEAIKQAEKELKNTSLTTEQRETLLNAIEEYRQSNIDAQNSIKDSIADRYEFEFDLIDKQADKVKKYSESLDYLLNVADLVNVSSSGKQSIYEAIYQAKVREYTNAKNSLAELESEQNKFAEGSYEWKLLQEKIDEVNESLQDFTIDALNANKDVLGSSLDVLQESLERGIFGGKSLDEWKDYQDNWVDGISKELELESLRQRLLDLEDDTLNKRLEALDRQEAVSQVDLDYIDKQAKVLELQQKLKNLENERNVQTLVRGDDGTWGWQYVADQTEYDKTKEDLADAEKELDKYKKEQRTQYATALNDIIEKAKNGEYDSSADIQRDIDTINSIYGNVIGDMPDMDTSSIAGIIAAYDKYVKDNGLIVDSAINGSQLSTETLEGIGNQFETSFKNISKDLGIIIGNELRSALGEASGGGGFNTYNVQIGSLEFPNVQDTTGMEEFFRDLPTIAEQLVYKK